MSRSPHHTPPYRDPYFDPLGSTDAALDDCASTFTGTELSCEPSYSLASTTSASTNTDITEPELKGLQNPPERQGSAHTPTTSLAQEIQPVPNFWGNIGDESGSAALPWLGWGAPLDIGDASQVGSSKIGPFLQPTFYPFRTVDAGYPHWGLPVLQDEGIGSSSSSSSQLISHLPTSRQWQSKSSAPYQKHQVTKLTEVIQSSLHELSRGDLSCLRDALQNTLLQVDSLLQKPSVMPTPPSRYIPARMDSMPQRWNCLLCGPEKLQIFPTFASFKRHMTIHNFAQFSYDCSDPGCGFHDDRRDRFRQHFRTKHSFVGSISKDQIDAARREFPVPSVCALCSNPVGSWDKFYQCMGSHCRLPVHDDTGKNTDLSNASNIPPTGDILPAHSWGRDNKRKRCAEASHSPIRPQDAENMKHDDHEHRTKRNRAPDINNKENVDHEHRKERIKQEPQSPVADFPTQISATMDSPQTDTHNTQSTEETPPARSSGGASAGSSMTTEVTIPEHEEQESIDAGIVQPNDLSVVLDAASYYEKLDKLAQETARICGIDHSLDVQDRNSSPLDCCISISNHLTALRNLQDEGFCRDALIILAKDRSRPDVAKAVHVPLFDISCLEESLKESLKGITCYPSIRVLSDVSQLIRKLRGDSASIDLTSTVEPYLTFLCAVFSIGLVSFSGSHVCRFDVDITGQPVEEIPVGLGDSYNLRKLACLSSFIGGPAWVLGKSEPLAQQEELKVSLTVQDLQELWGPVWLLGGSPDEGQIIRTERGYIVPLQRQEQRRREAEEIECHWTEDLPQYFMSQMDSQDRPMLRSTSRILVGTDTTTVTGLTVNETCRSQMSLIQRDMQLQIPGTTKAHLVDDGYEVNLMAGQYVTAGIVKKWKRMPARTQKSVLIELCRQPDTELVPLLKLRVGLEVSACSGNAQRVTLWDALRLSQAKAHTAGNPNSSCEHRFEDIKSMRSCIRSCWKRYNSAHEIDSLIDNPGEQNVLSKPDIRRLIIHSILALEHTGIDYDENLLAWWPFSESPLTSRISPTTSKECHHWFRVIKESPNVSTFAVLSQRCLEFRQRRCIQQQYSGRCTNGRWRARQTGLWTRLLPVKENDLVEGAKFLMGNAHLIVEQTLQKEIVVIAAVSTSTLRARLGGFLGEGKIPCTQEHIMVNHDTPINFSIPVFIY